MTFFKIGHEYDRGDLLFFVGSQQGQSGIIYGPKEPGCVIITSGGRHGKNSGYSNVKNDDGTWYYIGQGTKGDQNPDSFANSMLSKGERNVLLFSTREPTSKEKLNQGNGNKRYKFEGIFDVLSWRFYEPVTGDRIGDKLIEYHLIPANNIFNDFEVDSLDITPGTNLLEDILLKLRKSVPKDKTSNQYSVQEYIQRSSLVKKYALTRANGYCELCKKPSPFTTTKGFPFLEVHHILKLADDGPDNPENVAALCPNCHREAHFGLRKDNIKSVLIESIVSLQTTFLRDVTSF